MALFGYTGYTPMFDKVETIVGYTPEGKPIIESKAHIKEESLRHHIDMLKEQNIHQARMEAAKERTEIFKEQDNYSHQLLDFDPTATYIRSEVIAKPLSYLRKMSNVSIRELLHCSLYSKYSTNNVIKDTVEVRYAYNIIDKQEAFNHARIFVGPEWISVVWKILTAFPELKDFPIDKTYQVTLFDDKTLLVYSLPIKKELPSQPTQEVLWTEEDFVTPNIK